MVKINVNGVDLVNEIQSHSYTVKSTASLGALVASLLLWAVLRRRGMTFWGNTGQRRTLRHWLVCSLLSTLFPIAVYRLEEAGILNTAGSNKGGRLLIDTTGIGYLPDMELDLPLPDPSFLDLPPVKSHGRVPEQEYFVLSLVIFFIIIGFAAWYLQPERKREISPPRTPIGGPRSGGALIKPEDRKEETRTRKA